MVGRSAGLNGSKTSGGRGASTEEVDMYALFGDTSRKQA